MNVLIVEDEPKTAKLLKELVESQDKTVAVPAICDSIEATVNYLLAGNPKPDLIFMDIMLADGNSFEIFSQVKITAPVVFCTAYDDYIMQAFKHNGIDYILKPFKEKDIDNAFVKITQLKQAFAVTQDTARQLSAAVNHSAQQSAFLVQFREKMYPVQVKDIALAALENETVYLYTFDNQKHPLFKPIDDIENILGPAMFFRINRQMLVNRQAIVAIEPFFNRKVTITLKITPEEKPVVSRLKVTAFLNWMERG